MSLKSSVTVPVGSAMGQSCQSTSIVAQSLEERFALAPHESWYTSRAVYLAWRAEHPDHHLIIKTTCDFDLR
jgi:hypothetical protein